MTDQSRIPKRLFYGDSMNSMMSTVYQQWKIQNDILDEMGFSGRRVLGYKLPDWQRPSCWTDEQSVRFIQSVFLGIGLGQFMVNNTDNDSSLDMILVDGQQRLRAVERYWLGEFAVPGEDGNAYLWTELTGNEHAHFFRMTFPWINTQYRTEAAAKEAYNLLNFGGTAHTENQRA